jgi:hypothetical protein
MLFSDEDIRMIKAGEVDGRVKGSAGNPVREHSRQNMVRNYCVMCTKPMGWVTKECADYIAFMHVIGICGDCESQLGAPQLINADKELDLINNGKSPFKGL